MALTIGTQLGSHEITGLLGKGGMGEVYRARDLKLKREVAIKILPEEFSRDVDRVSRFQREAEVLASLNHPNIAGIYDLAEASGTRFLVLELVEGETLADRIARAPVPVEEALSIAIQICEALEAAHERGIIHRDLKPANIKLTADGKVKVLDFGLAKGMGPNAGSTTLSNSPTMLSGTMGGMILGTAAYMSPEQAKGRSVDRRTDIFAFGVVLFEMLTGKPPFDGDDVTEILGRVVTAEPDWEKLPAEAPLPIQRLIRRALKKDIRQRLGDIHDAKLEIEEAINAPPRRAEAVDSTIGKKRRAWAWAIAAIVFVAVSIPAMRHLLENPPDELRVEINTLSTSAPLEFALSPNGRYIVYVASGDGPQQLWLRALDKTGATPLPGSEGADDPFWSPDSRSIAFYAAGRLKRLDIGGGLPVVLANSPANFGGAWNGDGVIVFNAASGALSRIRASGGTTVAATRLGPQQVQHRFPTFLPDGRHFLFYGTGRSDIAGVYLASLDGGETKFLTKADSTGLYLAPDMIVFGSGTTLWARHLDLKKGQLTGEPVRLADFGGSGVLGSTGVSISSDGKIALRGGVQAQRQLKWYNRSGKFIGVAGEPDDGTPTYPELSPDEKQIALSRTVLGNTDIWLMDLTRGGVLTRFTVDPAIDTVPIWSPDGKQIAFSSARLGPMNTYVKRTNSSDAEVILMESLTRSLQDWSKDNRFYLYLESGKNARDLWARPVTGGDQNPIAVANSASVEQNGQFSPNGHWVAYETNESGPFQIVVQSFPERSFKRQVSQFGGNQPRWRADGKELYFIAPDGKMMAASITEEGSSLSAGSAQPLFQATAAAGTGTNRQEYVVTRDGRFLINQAVATSSASPITLILNWKPKS